MNPRVNYEMTEEDLQVILEACKPTAYIVIGGHAPTSPQENANRAWAALGAKMGFDPMTVRPAPGGNRFFTAVPSETDDQRADRIRLQMAEKKAIDIAQLKRDIERAQEKLAELEAQ